MIRNATVASQQTKLMNDEDTSETETSTIDSIVEDKETVPKTVNEEESESEEESSSIEKKPVLPENASKKSEKKKDEIKKTKEIKKPVHKETNLGTIIRGGGKITANKIISKQESTVVGNEIPYEYSIYYDNTTTPSKTKYVIVSDKKSLLQIEILNQEQPFGDETKMKLRNVEFTNNANYDNSQVEMNFEIAKCFMNNSDQFAEEGYTVVFVSEKVINGITQTTPITIEERSYYPFKEDSITIFSRNIIQFNDGAVLEKSNLNDCKDNNVHIITGGKFSDGSQDTLTSTVNSNQAVEFGENETGASGISHISTLKIQEYDINGIEDITSAVIEELTKGMKYTNSALYDTVDFQQYVIELTAKYNDYDILVTVAEGESETKVKLLDYIMNGGETEGLTEAISVEPKSAGEPGETSVYPSYSHVTEDLPLNEAVLSRIKIIEERVDAENGVEEGNHVNNGDEAITLKGAVAHTLCETPLQIKTITYNDGLQQTVKVGRQKKIITSEQSSDIVEFLNSDAGDTLKPEMITGVTFHELGHNEINDGTVDVLSKLQETEQYVKRTVEGESGSETYSYEYGKQDTFFRARFYQELLMNGLPLYQLNESSVVTDSEIPNEPVDPSLGNKKNEVGKSRKVPFNRKQKSRKETVPVGTWQFGAILKDGKERELYIKEDKGENKNQLFKDVFVVQDLVVFENNEMSIKTAVLEKLITSIWNPDNEIAEGWIVTITRDHWLADFKFKRVIDGQPGEVVSMYFLDFLYEYFHGYDDGEVIKNISYTTSEISLYFNDHHKYGTLMSKDYISKLAQCRSVCTLMATWVDIMVSAGKIVSEVVLREDTNSTSTVEFNEYLEKYLDREVIEIHFKSNDIVPDDSRQMATYINDKINESTVVTWKDLHDVLHGMTFEDSKYLFCPYFVFYDEGSDGLMQTPMAFQWSDFLDWFDTMFYNQLVTDNETEVPIDGSNENGVIKPTHMTKKLYRDKTTGKIVLIDVVKDIVIKGETSAELSASLSELTCSPCYMDNMVPFKGYMVPIDKQKYTRMIYELIEQHYPGEADICITFRRVDPKNIYEVPCSVNTTKSELKKYAYSETGDSENSIIGIINSISSESLDGYTPIEISSDPKYYYEAILFEIYVESKGQTVTMIHEDMNVYDTPTDAINDAMLVTDTTVEDPDILADSAQQLEWLIECGMKASRSSLTLLYTIKANDEDEWYEYAPLEWYYDEDYATKGKDNGYYIILEAINHDRIKPAEPKLFGVSYKHVDEFREIKDYFYEMNGYKKSMTKKNKNTVIKYVIEQLNKPGKKKISVVGGRKQRHQNINSKVAIKSLVEPLVVVCDKPENKTRLANFNGLNKCGPRQSKVIEHYSKQNGKRTSSRRMGTFFKKQIKSMQNSAIEDVGTVIMICGFRHYSMPLMIEYLQHVIAMQTCTNAFILRFAVKDTTSTEKTMCSTVNRLCEDLQGTDGEQNYELLISNYSISPENNVFNYCVNPIVSSYNLVPDLYEKNVEGETTEEQLKNTYDFYTSNMDIFEEGLTDDYTVRDVYDVILGESDSDTVWYDSKGGMVSQFDVIYTKTPDSHELDPEKEPRDLMYLMGTFPGDNESFEAYVKRILSIVERTEDTYTKEDKLPVPVGHALIGEENYTFNYINQWIYKQLVNKGVIVEREAEINGKVVPVHWTVSATQSIPGGTETVVYNYEDFVSNVGLMKENYSYELLAVEDKPSGDETDEIFFSSWEEAARDLVTYLNAVSNGSSEEKRGLKEYMHEWQYHCAKLSKDGSSSDSTFKEGCTVLIKKGEQEWYLDDLLAMTTIPEEFKTLQASDVEPISYVIKRVAGVNDDVNGVDVVDGEEFTQWFSNSEIITYDDKTIHRYVLNSQTDVSDILKYYNLLLGKKNAETGEPEDTWRIKNHTPTDNAIVVDENWDFHDMEWDEEQQDNGKNESETLDFMQQFEAERNKCQKSGEGNGNVMFLFCISSSFGTIITELFTEQYNPNRDLDAFMIQDYDDKTITQLVCKSIIKNSIDYEKLANEVLKNSLYEQSINTIQIFPESPFLNQLKSEIAESASDLVNEKDIQLGYIIMQRNLKVESIDPNVGSKSKRALRTKRTSVSTKSHN